MRTTITLDPDVEEYIREACHKKRKSFKSVVNDAIRQSLRPNKGPSPKLMEPRSMGLAAGIDPRQLNKLADDLEIEQHLAAEEARSYNRKPQ